MRKAKVGSRSGPEILARFKLYPDDDGGSNLHFEVLIFSSVAAMQKHLGPDSARKKAVAYCGDHGASRSGMKIGELCLGGLRYCDDTTVSHEILHAAVFWQKRYSGKFPGAYWHEEELAEIIGDLTGQFWRCFVNSFPRKHCYGWFEEDKNAPVRS